jgi:hypothetical protein
MVSNTKENLTRGLEGISFGKVFQLCALAFWWMVVVGEIANLPVYHFEEH